MNALALLEQARKDITSNDGRPMTELAISLVSAAQRALMQVETPDEAIDIRNTLISAETYLKKHRAQLIDGNLIAAQRLRTEHLIGEMIPIWFPHGGDRKSSSPRVNLILEDYCSRNQSSRWQKLSRIDFDELEYWIREYLEREELSTIAAIRFFMNLHIADDSYEWNTPKEYIDAARAVMGGIDLDPASNDEAQKMIKAGDYYTADDDGLAQPWHGRVWLNPPYNMPYIEQFVDRAIHEYEEGNIECALVLTNNATDTGWFHRLTNYPICFTKGRVQFWQVGGPELGPRQGQAIFYLGNNPDKFAKEYSQFGVVMKRYDNQ